MMDFNYKMWLGDEALYSLKFGIKVFEGRLFDEKRRKFKVGDIVRCSLKSDVDTFIDIRIIELKKYSSFREMFLELGGVVFGFEEGDSVDDFSLWYRKYYSEEREKELGVVGIKMELVG